MINNIINILDYSCSVNGTKILKNINMSVCTNCILSVIGPKESGKSILLKALNRTFELINNSKQSGEILFNAQNINKQNVYKIRQKISLISSKHNLFPRMTILENVLAGYILTNTKIDNITEVKILESALKSVGLWEKLRNSLHTEHQKLNLGDKIKLSIARAIAIYPKVLLLDDITAELDNNDKNDIERIIYELKSTHTIIFVTNDITQAARISDYTAFIADGELIEFGETNKMFTTPNNSMTEKYLIGDNY